MTIKESFGSSTTNWSSMRLSVLLPGAGHCFIQSNHQSNSLTSAQTGAIKFCLFYKYNVNRLLTNSYYKYNVNRLLTNSYYKYNVNRLLTNSYYKYNVSRLLTNSYVQIPARLCWIFRSTNTNLIFRLERYSLLTCLCSRSMYFLLKGACMWKIKPGNLLESFTWWCQALEFVKLSIL